MIRQFVRPCLAAAALFAATALVAQEASTAGLTDMRRSGHAKMANTPLGAVRWTGGFWGERFDVYSKTSLQSMWETWNDPDVSHGFRDRKSVV